MDVDINLTGTTGSEGIALVSSESLDRQERPRAPRLTPTTAGGESDANDALVAASLARRALCPECVCLGGCPFGIPGLMPLPEKGQVDPVTGKTSTYLMKLIEGTGDGLAVTAFRVRSRSGATRGQTYISGASYCATLRRSQIQRVKGQ